MERQKARSSQNKTHFALSLALFTRNYCPNTRSSRRTRRPSRRSETDLRDDEPGRPVRTTSLHQKIRSFGPTSLHQPIRSGGPTRSLQIARTVILRLHSSKFGKIGRLSDRYITVTFFEVREDRTVIGPLYYRYILRSSRRSDSYRTLILRSHSSEHLHDRTVMRRLRTVITTSKRTRNTLKHKSLYAQKPYLVRISRFERISCLRAKPYLIIRNKLLYAQSRTCYA